jgi:hypothetical protein
MTNLPHSMARWAALAAIAAAFLLLGSLGRAEADGPYPDPAIVTVTPANQSVPAGSQVVVDITLADFPDPDGLGAYEIALTWDPNVLDFNCPTASCTANFTNGPLLGSTGRTAFCLPPARDADGDDVDDPGFVKVGCTTFSPPPNGPTDDGLLATLRFDTSCAGETILALSLVTLSDPLAEDKDDPPGEDIQYNISGANATVTGGQPCGVGHPVGDANCNDVVNAIDAAFILQHDAGLLATLPCPDEADVNGSGNADPLDALLVLQFDAGLLTQLPP